jgi:hypothetical protein
LWTHFAEPERSTKAKRLFEKRSTDLFEPFRVGAIGHRPREAEGAL